MKAITVAAIQPMPVSETMDDLRDGNEIDHALEHFRQACINSLQHGLNIHIRIVEIIGKSLHNLDLEGKNNLADHVRKYLIENWKKQGLHKKVPELIEYIEKSKT